MTKHYFLITILTLFVSAFSFGQTAITTTISAGPQTFQTAGGKNIIIDDRIIGFVSTVRCHSVLSETVNLSPPVSANAVYYVIVRNSTMPVSMAFNVSYNGQLWEFGYISAVNQSDKVEYENFNFHSFMFNNFSPDFSLFQPEVDDNGILTLTGQNGTLLEAIYVKKPKEDTADPCNFAKAVPNPTDGLIYVDIEVDIARVANITVYDNFGNISQEISDVSLSAGNNTRMIDLSNLSEGLYRIRVETGHRSQIIPVQKN
jgi:hypothetical protein